MKLLRTLSGARLWLLGGFLLLLLVAQHRLLLGTLYANLGRLEWHKAYLGSSEGEERLQKAEGFLEEAEKYLADDPRLYLDLGKTYVLRRKYAEALQTFTHLKTLIGNVEEVTNWLVKEGNDNLSRNPQEAERILSLALSLDPENPPVYLRLGLLYRSLGDYQKAIDNLKLAAQYAGEEEFKGVKVQAYHWLGLIYWQNVEDIPTAEKYFQETIALDPANGFMWWTWAAYVDLGSIALKKEEREEQERALYFFEKALQVAATARQRSDAHYYKAHAFLQFGNEAEAREELEKAIEADPTKHACLALADLHLETGNPEQAAKYYEKVLSLDPENARARQQLEQIRSEKNSET